MHASFPLLQPAEPDLSERSHAQSNAASHAFHVFRNRKHTQRENHAHTHHHLPTRLRRKQAGGAREARNSLLSANLYMIEKKEEKKSRCFFNYTELVGGQRVTSVRDLAVALFDLMPCVVLCCVR